MLKIAFTESVSKQYLQMKDAMRRNKKLVSTMKLIVVICIFLGVLGGYARNVTVSSTKGYFLREDMQEYENLVFERSIVKLDILQLEKVVLDSVQENAGSRYGYQDRVEIVDPNEKPSVKQEELNQQDEGAPLG